MYYIAIDVGIKNLSFAVFNTTTNKIDHWQRISLVKNGKYMPSHNVQYVHELINDNMLYFSNASVVVIERQIRTNMRIIESVFHALFYSKVHIVPAKNVKMHFGLSTKNYRMNKRKAVEFVQNFIDTAHSAEWPSNSIHNIVKHGALNCRDVFACEKKQDDLADSLCLMLYYLDTFSDKFNTM